MKRNRAAQLQNLQLSILIEKCLVRIGVGGVCTHTLLLREQMGMVDAIANKYHCLLQVKPIDDWVELKNVLNEHAFHQRYLIYSQILFNFPKQNTHKKKIKLSIKKSSKKPSFIIIVGIYRKQQGITALLNMIENTSQTATKCFSCHSDENA